MNCNYQAPLSYYHLLFSSASPHDLAASRARKGKEKRKKEEEGESHGLRDLRFPRARRFSAARSCRCFLYQRLIIVGSRRLIVAVEEGEGGMKKRGRGKHNRINLETASGYAQRSILHYSGHKPTLRESKRKRGKGGEWRRDHHQQFLSLFHSGETRRRIGRKGGEGGKPQNSHTKGALDQCLLLYKPLAAEPVLDRGEE